MYAKKKNISAEEPLQSSDSREGNPVLLLQQGPQQTLMTTGTASQFQVSAFCRERTKKSLYVMEFDLLTLMIKSKYRYQSPGSDKYLEL